MKKNTLLLTAMTASLLLSSCVAKKELVGCREDNRNRPEV